jgi:hypothetical protein
LSIPAVVEAAVAPYKHPRHGSRGPAQWPDGKILRREIKPPDATGQNAFPGVGAGPMQVEVSEGRGWLERFGSLRRRVPGRDPRSEREKSHVQPLTSTETRLLASRGGGFGVLGTSAHRPESQVATRH